MLIASKSDHDPMVHGVKSKIRKTNAGKSSSCPEYAQASVQIPREDQPMILGPDQTIGVIYRLFRKCSGGADGGVLGVNGSIRPSCLDKVLCALQVNGRVFIDFGAGDGRAQVASLLKGAISAYGYELPANKAHRFVLNAVLSKCSEDVITRVHWISKDIDELAELPDGTASCAFSFWVGIPLATQEKILSLCASSLSIRSVCVFRDSKWRTSGPPPHRRRRGSGARAPGS